MKSYIALVLISYVLTCLASKASSREQSPANIAEPKPEVALFSALRSAYPDKDAIVDASTKTREFIAQTQRKLGPDHPSCLALQLQYASALSSVRLNDEAEAICRDVVAKRLRLYGYGHYLTREAWLGLASVLGEKKDHQDCAQIWKLILESRESALGRKSWMTIDAYYNCGLALARCYQHAAAEVMLVEAVSRCGAKPGDGGIVPDYVSLLAYVQLSLRQFEAAEKTCRLWLALRHTHVDTEAWAHRRLAAALTGLERFVEAEAELKHAISRNDPWKSLKWHDAKEVHFELARVIDYQRRHQDAEAAYLKILAALDQDGGIDLPLCLEICHMLAKCLQSQGRADEALPYAHRAVTGLLHWPKENLPRTEFIALESALSKTGK